MKNETLLSVIDMTHTHRQLAEKYIGTSSLKLLRIPEANEFPNQLSYVISQKLY